MDLGWVDFDLGVTPISSCCPAASAKFQSAQAEFGRQWNTQNPSHPNPGLRADESPCTDHIFPTSSVLLQIPYDISSNSLTNANDVSKRAQSMR